MGEETTRLFVDPAIFMEAASAFPPGKPHLHMIVLTVSRIDRNLKPVTKGEMDRAKSGEVFADEENPTFFDQLLLTAEDAHKLAFSILAVMRDQGYTLAAQMLKAATDFSQENQNGSPEYKDGGGGPGV